MTGGLRLSSETRENHLHERPLRGRGRHQRVARESNIGRILAFPSWATKLRTMISRRVSGKRLDRSANVQTAASTLGNVMKRHWLPIAGALLTLAVLAFGPVLSIPFQAFLDFCFGEAADDADMSGGLLMWFTMRPVWSALTLGLSLVAIGALVKSVVADPPKSVIPGEAHQPEPVNPGTDKHTGRVSAGVAVQPKPDGAPDESTFYAVMIWAAEVTGGIAPEELAIMFENLTGMKAPKWARTYPLTEQARPHPTMVIILDKVREKGDQRTIMALALSVCMTRKKFSKQATQLIWLLAAKFRMTKAEVRELYESIRSDNRITEAA